jgi:hypothetical protein
MGHKLRQPAENLGRFEAGFFRFEGTRRMTAHNHSKRPLVHSTTLRVRLHPQLCDGIREAATARGMSASGWMRQAATTVAMLEGVGFPDMRPDGKRRYARIEGGAVVDVAYLPDVPESA